MNRLIEVMAMARAKKTRDKAGRVVRTALEKGVLVRPETCSRCATTPPRLKGGLPAIQGHHHDYSRPLDVEWICVQCHRDETPNGMALKTHCRKGHPYSGDNLITRKNGCRECRTCNQARDMARPRAQAAPTQ